MKNRLLNAFESLPADIQLQIVKKLEAISRLEREITLTSEFGSISQVSEKVLIH